MSDDVIPLLQGVPGLKGYIEDKDKYVKLQIGKNSWNVKLLCFTNSPSHNRVFSAGWSLFAKENQLMPGDVCVFEMIKSQRETKSEDLIFEVHVYKANS